MRTLKSMFVIFAVAICIAVSTVSSVQATDFTWGGAVGLTEMSPGGGIFSHIDASRNGRMVGSWFSTSNVLPVLADGLEYAAYGDFPGISKIQEVVLSPDSGITRWPATQVPGKGWKVELPIGDRYADSRTFDGRPCQIVVPGLNPGGYGLEWGVRSRDKRGRLMLIIIPITWSALRTSSAANHVMVQAAPSNCDSYNAVQWFAFLRGFVPAWATPDPAVLVAQQMQNQLTQPVQTVRPQPARPRQRVRPVSKTVKLILCLDDEQRSMSCQLDTSSLFAGQRLEFRRDGQTVIVAEIDSVDGTAVEASVTAGGWPQSGDRIFMGGN